MYDVWVLALTSSFFAQVNVDFLLCADYKFLLLLFGMKGANGMYPCLWCCADSDHLGEAGEARDIRKMNAQFRRGGGPGLKHLALFRYFDVKKVYLGMWSETPPVFGTYYFYRFCRPLASELLYLACPASPFLLPLRTTIDIS